MHVNSLCLGRVERVIYNANGSMANRTYICLVSKNFLFHCIQAKVFFPENLFDISSILWVDPLTRRYHISGTNGQVVQLLQKV